MGGTGELWMNGVLLILEHSEDSILFGKKISFQKKMEKNEFLRFSWDFCIFLKTIFDNFFYFLGLFWTFGFC